MRSRPPTHSSLQTALFGALVALTVAGISAGAALALAGTNAHGARRPAGQGRMIISPSSFKAGQKRVKLTFDFTATSNAAAAGGDVTVRIPGEWTAPHTGRTPAAGRVGVRAMTCGAASISGMAGSTVIVRIRCKRQQLFELTYSGVTVPARRGTYVFQTASAGDTIVRRKPRHGKLVPIAHQPSVLVAGPAVPVAAARLTVSAPSTATAGTAFALTVTAVDSNGTTVPGYGGTVGLKSSDGAAMLPAGSHLVHGTGIFSVTLKTAGTQTLTATDTVTSSITGTSGPVSVGPGPAARLTLATPSSATAGGSFSLTVTALDQFGNTATGYTGTLHFTSSDGGATLPANTTLSSGTGTFSATLTAAGNQTLTVTDTAAGSLTATTGAIAVSPGSASKLAVSAPSAATAGTAFTFTVTAQDSYGNTTSYGGTLHFTSTDGAAVLPSDSTLPGSGTGTFTATLKTAGARTLTARDTVASSITGTSGTVTVGAAAATHLAVSAPATATLNTAFSFTVTALDQFGNTATGYAGTVHFTSTDGAAVLPADSTLTNGAGTFSATLKTAGSRTLTGTDTVTSSITGTSGSIAVS